MIEFINNTCFYKTMVFVEAGFVGTLIWLNIEDMTYLVVTRNYQG